MVTACESKLMSVAMMSWSEPFGTLAVPGFTLMLIAFVDAAKARGLPVELRWCPDSGHNAPAGMPAEVCRDDYGSWLRDFFGRALSTEP